MPVRPHHHHRVPCARLAPITDPDTALALVSGLLSRPPVAETIALVLDDARCGLTAVSVSGTTHPDHAIEVVECLTNRAAFGSFAHAIVLASSRPDGGIVDGDVDRWLEMCDIAERAGVEVVEWFVIGSGVSCPHDLLGAPPRWRDGAGRA